MSQLNYPIGAVVVANNGQHTKIVSEKNGVYGITGWSSKRSAEKANVARKFINVHGLKYAGARIVSESGNEEEADAPAESSNEESETSEKEASEYSRTDLREMKVDKLYPLAESVGVSTDDKNKPDVLNDLYDHFGL